MPKISDRSAISQWEPGPIIDWLLDEGRLLSDIDEFVGQLGSRMLASGAPLWRLRLSMRTLHPLVAAVTSLWERDSGATTPLSSPHGLEGRSGYIGSPLETMNRTRAPFRKRLTDALSSTDHEVLHDLKARGATDYIGIPMKFSNGAMAFIVFTADVADGFSDRDIQGFARIASVLAPIVEVFNSRSVSLAVAEAYLGPRTGQRVLDGQITRGDIEKINAAILVSDIRDWTGLNNHHTVEDAVVLANRYFEAIAEAVESNGGEILKFLGDGVLAIFSADEDETPDRDPVCERALAAARQAMQIAREADPPLDLSFGIGMHFGEVLYGNVGSKTRIDFTVLGQAVNVAARIEGLCGELHRPILFSQDFADRLAEPTTLVAEKILKGLETAVGVLATAEDSRTTS